MKLHELKWTDGKKYKMIIDRSFYNSPNLDACDGIEVIVKDKELRFENFYDQEPMDYLTQHFNIGDLILYAEFEEIQEPLKDINKEVLNLINLRHKSNIQFDTIFKVLEKDTNTTYKYFVLQNLTFVLNYHDAGDSSIDPTILGELLTNDNYKIIFD